MPETAMTNPDLSDTVKGTAALEDASLPTPLRRRRAASPPPSATRDNASSDLLLDPSDTTRRSSVPTPVTQHRRTGSQPASTPSTTTNRYGWAKAKLANCCLVIVIVVSTLMLISVLASKTGGRRKEVVDIKPISEVSGENKTSSWFNPAPKEVIINWRHRVSEALKCSGVRSDILDITAGVSFEFGNETMGATNYHSIAATAAAAYNEQSKFVGDYKSTLTRLHETVFQLVDGADFVPAALRRRVREVVSSKCAEFSRCTEGSTQDLPLALEIDKARTSEGAESGTSSWVHRKLLGFGASLGLSRLKERAEHYRSKPASVILGSTASSVNLKDCFAFRKNSSVALRVQQHGRDAYINHITIEQPPRWNTPRPHASPRRFSVFGMDSAAPEGKFPTPGNGPYTVPLGSFEYLLAAPHVQAFQLQRPAKNGLLIVFDGEGWSQEHCTCLYRLRAYEMLPPSCVGRRLARIIAA